MSTQERLPSVKVRSSSRTIGEDIPDHRLEFSEFIIDQGEDNSNRILFSDEAVFHVNSSVNRHDIYTTGLEKTRTQLLHLV